MPYSNLVPYADPIRAGRHPFQTYLLALCVVSGVPLLFGYINAESMHVLLPTWAVFVWGGSLSIGALIGLVGSYWPTSAYATALTLERIGLLIVGPAALMYSGVILISAGVSRLVAVAIVAAFGAASLYRARDIGKVITRAIASARGELPNVPDNSEHEPAMMGRIISDIFAADAAEDKSTRDDADAADAHARSEASDKCDRQDAEALDPMLAIDLDADERDEPRR